jgi:Glycosyltransferase family 87
VTISSDASSPRSPRWTVPPRLRAPALILLALLGLAVVGYAILRGATYSNDFKNPYRVARVFWRTGQLDIASEPRYPPTARVLLAPLAALPIATAATVWVAASVAALAALPRLFARLGGIPVRAQALGWLAVLTFVIDGLVLGQSDPINLFLVTAGLVLARERSATAGAALIGLAAMIKVLPAVCWGVLVACRRARGAVAGVLVSAVAALALLTGFAGWSAGVHSVAEWYTIIGQQEGPWGLIEGGNSLRENNESLPVVLARTFGDVDRGLTRNAVSLARLPLGAVWGAWLAILAAMGLVWLACVGRVRRAPPARAWLGMFALTAVIMLALTPIAWPHYFLWLLPAALFLADRPRVLVTAAALGQLGMMVPVLRGLGCHMWIALAFFALVASDLLGTRPAPSAAAAPSKRVRG